jgi:hypothetical protein
MGKLEGKAAGDERAFMPRRTGLADWTTPATAGGGNEAATRSHNSQVNTMLIDLGVVFLIFTSEQDSLTKAQSF